MSEPEQEDWFRDLEEIAAELEGEVDSDGPTHVQLIDLVRGVRDERDRLRAQLHELMARDVDAVDLMNAEYGCPDCGVHHACGETVAERDRLRAVVERAHDDVGQDERALRSLVKDDLVALVGVLRRDYALATNAADAAAEAVGNMADYASQAVAERDRLRALVGAVQLAGLAVLDGIDWQRATGKAEPVPINRLADLQSALEALDGSADMGDTDAVTPEDMGNPDWYRED